MLEHFVERDADRALLHAREGLHEGERGFVAGVVFVELDLVSGLLGHAPM